MSWLLFIDTNIFLDFYRMRGGDAAKNQIDFIDEHRKKIITSSQVQMEFMKHRQEALIGTIKEIGGSLANINQVPPVLIGSQASKQISKYIDRIKNQQKKLRERMERILTDPVHHDRVYQCAQRLFRARSEINLSRTHKGRNEVRELAEKRFKLGYPPRKKNDTSLGDAIHWEWIIDCAARKQSNVLVVSRDGDFGSSHGGNDHINDWLLKEFRERVGRKWRVELSKRLTDAMVRFDVEVSAEDKAEENELLEARHPGIYGFRNISDPTGIFGYNRLLQGVDPRILFQTNLATAAEALRINPLLLLSEQIQAATTDPLEQLRAATVSPLEEAARAMATWRRLAEFHPGNSIDAQDSEEEEDKEPKKRKKGGKKKRGKKKD